MKKMMKGLLAGLALGAVAALAFTSNVFARGGGACTADIANFCLGDQGWKAIHACLDANQAQLSPACTQERAAHKAKWEKRKADFQAACGADEKTYCSNAEATGKPGEVRQCLRTNENSISAACKGELTKHHHHHETATSQG